MSQDWKEKLVTEFKRDWRRTAVLVTLTIVALFLLVKQFAGSSTPAAAEGADSSYRTDQGGAGHSGAVPPGAIQPAAAAPTRNQAALRMPSSDWMTNPAKQLAALPVPRRDPFKINLEAFPLDPAKSAKPTDVKTTDVKMTDEQRDQMRKARQTAIAAEAQSLKLQSVLMASPPRVMINGTIYRSGQTVVAADKDHPFKVERISPSSAVLEKEGFEVHLMLE